MIYKLQKEALFLIFFILLLGSCAKPVKLSINKSNLTISDLNKGVLKKIDIRVNSTHPDSLCYLTISKNYDYLGDRVLSLVNENNGYRHYGHCDFIKNVEYMFVGCNIGFCDTLIVIW